MSLVALMTRDRAVILVAERRYPRGHVIARASRVNIRCHCGRPAERTEHSYFTKCDGRGDGVSFWNYCDRCWITVGPDGSSPRDRASRPRAQ